MRRIGCGCGKIPRPAWKCPLPSLTVRALCACGLSLPPAVQSSFANSRHLPLAWAFPKVTQKVMVKQQPDQSSLLSQRNLEAWGSYMKCEDKSSVASYCVGTVHRQAICAAGERLDRCHACPHPHALWHGLLALPRRSKVENTWLSPGLNAVTFEQLENCGGFWAS